MRSIDISVIVTVYNIKQYIEECVSSILQENRINVELILVDDCSTDGSYELICELEKKDERIRVIKNEINKGITSSRNAGLRASTGKYVYVMDGDDYLKKDALYFMYNTCENHKLDMLEFSGDVLYQENDEKMKVFANEDTYRRSIQCNVIRTGPQMLSDLLHKREKVRWSVYLHCYNGELLRKKGLYYVEGLRYADGSEFHLFMAANRVMCVEDALYMRRVRPNSQITSSLKIHYLESLIILFVEEMKLWDCRNYSDYINAGIEKYFLIRSREIMEMYQPFKNSKEETKLLNCHPQARFYFNYFLKNTPICEDSFDEEQKNMIKMANKIYIYGTGFYAGEISSLLNYWNIDYEFVVTDINNNIKEYCGRRVHGIEDVSLEDSLVIVAMAQIHYEDIKRIMRDKAYKDIIYLNY